MLRARTRRGGCAAIRRVFVCCCVVAAARQRASPNRKPTPRAARRRPQRASPVTARRKRRRSPGMPALAGQQAEFLVLQMILIREGLRDVPRDERPAERIHRSATSTDVAAYFAGQAAAAGNDKPDPKLQARGAELAKAMGCGSCHIGELTRAAAGSAAHQPARGLPRRVAQGVSRQQAHRHRHQHEQRDVQGDRRRHPGARALPRPYE